MSRESIADACLLAGASARLKPKAENIPEGTPYFAGEHIEDHWVEYPWEQTDIRRHVSPLRAASDRASLSLLKLTDPHLAWHRRTRWLSASRRGLSRPSTFLVRHEPG
jgi:hypothetical protein